MPVARDSTEIVEIDSVLAIMELSSLEYTTRRNGNPNWRCGKMFVNAKDKWVVLDMKDGLLSYYGFV